MIRFGLFNRKLFRIESGMLVYLPLPTLVGILTTTYTRAIRRNIYAFRQHIYTRRVQ